MIKNVKRNCAVWCLRGKEHGGVYVGKRSRGEYGGKVYVFMRFRSLQNCSQAEFCYAFILRYEDNYLV